MWFIRILYSESYRWVSNNLYKKSSANRKTANEAFFMERILAIAEAENEGRLAQAKHKSKLEDEEESPKVVRTNPSH